MMETKDRITTLYLDIETFGGEKPPLDAITPDARLKDPEKIAKNLEEKQEKQWRLQALDPFLGDVLCVAVAEDEGEAISFFEVDNEGSYIEAATLAKLDNHLQQYHEIRIVGHNIIDFDAHWLFVKGLKYGFHNLIKAFSDKLWLVDTMLLMDGPAWKKMTSLDKMARLFGFEGKTDMDGSKVHDAYLSGELEKIDTYCKDDVVTLRKCYQKMMQYGLYVR